MGATQRLVLDQIKVTSFTTSLREEPQKRVVGGVSQSDCPFSNQEGCTEESHCSDANFCHDSYCCGIIPY